MRTLIAEELEVGFIAAANTGKSASAPDTLDSDASYPDVLVPIGLLKTYPGVLLTGGSRNVQDIPPSCGGNLAK